MSTSPFARDATSRRLLDDGYSLSLEGSHLLVERVPYRTADASVRYGRLALPIVFSGDEVKDDSGDHRIWFVGEQPCDHEGSPIGGVSPQLHAITPTLMADSMVSSKPRTGATYSDMYEKVTSYVRILAHPAMALDPTVTATPGAAFLEVEDGLPFVYRDTATSRAGLATLNATFLGHRIGIVGLGGTGSYILDQVAKTWVDEIRLFDGDVFDNHNAFRAPGAATIEDLRLRPNRAEHFRRVYSHMHKGITAYPTFIDRDSVELLSGCTFVFIAAAEADDKPHTLGWLMERENARLIWPHRACLIWL